MRRKGKTLSIPCAVTFSRTRNFKKNTNNLSLNNFVCFAQLPMLNQYKTYYIIPLNSLHQNIRTKTEHHYRVRIRSRVHAIFTKRQNF